MIRQNRDILFALPPASVQIQGIISEKMNLVTEGTLKKIDFLDIKKIKSVNALIYKLIGRLDTTTAPDLETELQNSLDGIEHLTFDLEDLEYISSAGLRVLLFAIRRMNAQGTLVVKNANDLVMEVFNITGFSSLIELE